MGFRDPEFLAKMQFNAALVVHKKQFYRLFSHALVHANWSHLLVNMFVLFFFGVGVENQFDIYFGKMAKGFFLLLYLGGILFSNIYSLVKQRNNYGYNAIGASGAVSAVLFAFIFLNPWEKIYFFGILPIPGIIFAVLYVIYSYYMDKKQNDNVAHDAHLFGALFGFLFPALLKPHLFEHFINQLLSIF